MDSDILGEHATFKIEVSKLRYLLGYIGRFYGRNKKMEPNPENVGLFRILKVQFSLL
jgi:hypothetical protein